jgi:transposase
MLKLPSLGELDRAVRVPIYLAVGTTDMRRGFDSLAAMVRDGLGHDPLSGSLFLFVGRQRDRLKILYWDRDGFALWYKRLEAGTFRLPRAEAPAPGAPGALGGAGAGGAAAASVELKASELAMLLDGIDLARVTRRRRFVRPPPDAPPAAPPAAPPGLPPAAPKPRKPGG